MSKIRTDEKYYQEIVDELNFLFDEDIQSNPAEIIERLKQNLSRSQDKLYGSPQNPQLFFPNCITIYDDNRLNNWQYEGTNGTIKSVNSLIGPYNNFQSDQKKLIISSQYCGLDLVHVDINPDWNNNASEANFMIISRKSNSSIAIPEFDTILMTSDLPSPIHRNYNINTSNLLLFKYIILITILMIMSYFSPQQNEFLAWGVDICNAINNNNLNLAKEKAKQYITFSPELEEKINNNVLLDDFNINDAIFYTITINSNDAIEALEITIEIKRQA